MRLYLEMIGRACVGVLVLLGATMLCIAWSGCAQVEHVGNTGKRVLIDCGKEQVLRTVNEMGPVVENLLYDNVDGEGHVNWGPVKDAAKRWSMELGGCVLSDVIARALAPPRADPNAPKISTLDVNKEELRQGFEQLKAEFFGGITFVMANGQKL